MLPEIDTQEQRPRSKPYARSIARALQFLREHQDRCGCWTDWQLPPGASTMWVTAYIGYRLASLPLEDRGPIEESLARASRWLLSVEFPEGGWGYSGATGPDADSTALALMFLSARGDLLAPRAWDRLDAHRQPDGGFATFTRDASYGSWVISHPDVTAMALQAVVSTRGPEAGRIDEGIGYLRRHQRPDGLWDAFWWDSSLYTTEAVFALFQAAGQSIVERPLRGSLSAIRPRTAFECALQLLCFVRVGMPPAAISRCADAVEAAQLEDGSWPCSPVLRLTSRSVYEPWRKPDPEPLYADEQRLFTTATVVAALAATGFEYVAS